jgi:hypothetical protein
MPAKVIRQLVEGGHVDWSYYDRKYTFALVSNEGRKDYNVTGVWFTYYGNVERMNWTYLEDGVEYELNTPTSKSSNSCQ